jgi:hypothetical protein
MPNPQSAATPPAALTRRDLEARIIAKAWKDPNYKARLLSNAKAVLQNEISAVDPSLLLPPALQVQVHEEAPDVYHLVLPRNPKDIALGELLGDNLEAVSPQTIAVIVVTASNVTSTPLTAVNVCAVVQVANVTTVSVNAVGNVIA